MENENHYQPEITEETKEKAEARSILDSSLSGKTETELTPEQQEAEREFGIKNLESLLEQIDKEEIMAHGTREKITAILAIGIKSHTQRSSGKIKDPELAKMAEGSGINDPIWQGVSAEFVLEKAILPYAKLLTEESDSAVLMQKKEELLRNLPKIGKKRVEWFLNNAVPKIIEAGFDPHSFSYGINKTPEGEMLFNKWHDLATIVAGEDLISSTPASYLKHSFNRKHANLLSHYGGFIIYFDIPNELRMYNLGHARGYENDTDDIGVSSTITPSHFKAFRFGNYDRDNRIFYLSQHVGLDNIAKLVEFQNKRVAFFDESLVSLPPLESIKIIDPGYEEIPNNRLMRRLDHPSPEQKLMYQRMDEIKTKNDAENHKWISKIVKEKGYKWGETKDN